MKTKLIIMSLALFLTPLAHAQTTGMTIQQAYRFFNKPYVEATVNKIEDSGFEYSLFKNKDEVVIFTTVTKVNRKGFLIDELVYLAKQYSEQFEYVMQMEGKLFYTSNSVIMVISADKLEVEFVQRRKE